MMWPGPHTHTTPRTETTDACLSFTLPSGVPSKKPWDRPPNERDPSHSILLDLQEDSEWKMDSTVFTNRIDPALPLEDDMQVQCLPVYKVDGPEWTYRKVPKVSSFRSFDRPPSRCRTPQPFTYHVCAEAITKCTLVHYLPDEDSRRLKDGILGTLSVIAGSRHPMRRQPHPGMGQRISGKARMDLSRLSMEARSIWHGG